MAVTLHFRAILLKVIGMYARIGLVGDVHAEDHHLEKALDFLQQQAVDVILCTGDVADGSGDLSRCIALLAEHQVAVVRGNHDRWLLEDKARHIPDAHLVDQLNAEELAYLANLPVEISIDTPLGALLLCHGVRRNDLKKVWPGTDRLPVEKCQHMDALIRSREYALMVNGHMHYRTLIHFDRLTLINAGTLKGRHRPGFSLLDCHAGEITGYEFQPDPTPVRTLPVGHTADVEIFADTQAFTGQWQPLTLYD